MPNLPVFNGLKRYIITLVTLGRLTDVSLNKNGGSREAGKNKGPVWVDGERMNFPCILYFSRYLRFKIQRIEAYWMARRHNRRLTETQVEAYCHLAGGILVIFTARKLENLVFIHRSAIMFYTTQMYFNSDYFFIDFNVNGFYSSWQMNK